jgi:phage-related tail fiber protein
MCTDIGNAAIANSVLTGTKVNFAQIAVGDASGMPYVPVSGMTALKHQVWSGAIGEVSQDSQQPNRMILHAVLPSSVGGWVMREIGVLDDKGQLIAIGNTPEIPKEVVTSGAIMEMDLYIYISVVDARGVNVVIDPTVIIATKADINKLWQAVNAHLADKNNPHETTAAQVGALPATTTALKNPSALTFAQGYGGDTGAYDGSAAKTVSIPKITITDTDPGSTYIGDGCLVGVYKTS